MRDEKKRSAEFRQTEMDELRQHFTTVLEDIERDTAAKNEEIRVLKARLEKEGEEAERVREAEERADAMRDAKETAERKCVASERKFDALQAEKDRLVTETSDLHEHVRDLEEALREERERSHSLEVAAKNDASALAQKEIQSTELQNRALEAEEALDELADELETTVANLEQANRRVSELEDQIEDVQRKAEKAESQVMQLEAALEATEQKAPEDEDEIDRLRRTVSALEQEKDDLLAAQAANDNSPHSSRRHNETMMSTIQEERVAELQDRLDDAHREIARLEHRLKDSPTRKAISQAKDERIDLLESEKKTLEERVSALQEALDSMVPSGGATPGKTFRRSPALHRNVLSVKTPKTPGGPLKDVNILCLPPCHS